MISEDFFFWGGGVSFGERWIHFIRVPPPNHWSADMKCHDSLCPPPPPPKVKPPPPFVFIIFVWKGVCPLRRPHLATPCRVVVVFFLQFWDRINLPSILYFFWSKLIFNENNDFTLFVGWQFNIEPLHISDWCILFYFTYLHFWGRRVCTNVVVCIFEGAVFAQIWMFAHLKAKCLHKMWLFAHLWFLHI